MKAKTILYLFFAALLTLSCTGESIKLTYSNQATKIDDYVKKQLEDNPERRAVITDGIVRLVEVEGEGDGLQEDGTVSFLYAGYDFSAYSISSSKLFATNSPDIAQEAKWAISDSTLLGEKIVSLKDNILIEGLQKGLVGVREGEECYIIFPGDRAFGKNTLGTIPAYAPLAYHFWINKIENF